MQQCVNSIFIKYESNNYSTKVLYILMAISDDGINDVTITTKNEKHQTFIVFYKRFSFR